MLAYGENLADDLPPDVGAEEVSQLKGELPTCSVTRQNQVCSYARNRHLWPGHNIGLRYADRAPLQPQKKRPRPIWTIR